MRTRSMAIAALALAALLFSSLAPMVGAQAIESTFDPVDRIVAVGDVHGAYETFVETLIRARVIDEDLQWVGGRTHLVQTGDVLDRGPDSRKAMDLLMALEPQAEASGGRVHALIGNHEFWNAVGDLSYVSKGELEAFDGERDRELRKAGGVEVAPRGALALREAFSAEGKYGKWVRQNNTVVKIGDTVFVHGGITPDVAELSLAEINRRVRAELDREDWEAGLALQEDGPLMTRRYSSENLTAEEARERLPEVQAVLESLGARRMVVGHTVTFGLIEPRFEGGLILIDAGMFEGYLGGRSAALVLEGERLAAVYPEGEVVIPTGLSGEAGGRYVEAAVSAAPEDEALKQRLAEIRQREGRLKEAAALYEEVGVFDLRSRLPYSWRKEAAECFEQMGERDKAERLFDLYLSGLGTTAERMGRPGIPLLNRFAREALQLGLRTDEAFEAARQATAAYPKNLSFKVTLAWAYLERGDARRASRVLNGVKRLGQDSFYTHFILGRARLALDQPAEALEAFREAARFEPDHPELKEMIAKLTDGSN